MSVLDRKLRRDLWATKGLLATIVFLITVGIMSFVMFLTLSLNLDQALNSYYAQCRMADFWVNLEKVALPDLMRAASIPGVAEVRPRITFPVSLDLEGSARPVSGQVISLPDEPSPVINGVLIQSGGYFTNLRREEVILSAAFARNRDLRPGDKVRALLNGKQQELHVVGIAMASEYAITIRPGGLPDVENYAIIYVKQSFAEEAFDYQGAANQLVGLLAPEYRDRSGAVQQRLETLLRPYGEPQVLTRDDQTSHSLLSARIVQMRTVNLIVPSLFLIVAALIMNVLMMRIAEQQRTIVGTLKALGHRDWDLCLHYLQYGMVVGLIGGLIGIGLGQLAAGGMMRSMRTLFDFPRLENRPIYPLLLACTCLSLFISILGTLNGVLRVMHLNPAAAMRPKPPAAISRTFLENLGILWRNLGFRWQMVLRGIVRHKLRTATNLFAASMGTAVILLVLHTIDAVHELLSFTYDKVLVSDADLTLQDELPYETIYEVARLPGVEHVEPLLYVPGTFEHGLHTERGGIMGIQPDATMTVPRNSDGSRATLPDSGLLISTRMAEKLRAGIGDVITLRPSKGNRDPLVLTVANIVESYTGATVYANFSFLNRMVDEEDAVNKVQLRMQDYPGALRDLNLALKPIPNIQQADSAQEMKAAMNENVAVLMVMMSVMILCSGGLFCGSMLTTTMIALTERRQEIATFRVLGYQPWTVAGIFFRESALLNSIGILLGIPIGYYLSQLIDRLTATDVVVLPFVITRQSYVMTILLGVVFTLVAQILVHRVVARFDWKDALNIKE